MINVQDKIQSNLYYKSRFLFIKFQGGIVFLTFNTFGSKSTFSEKQISQFRIGFFIVSLFFDLIDKN